MEFFEAIKSILVEMWDALYRFLADLMDEEVNEDWLISGK